MRPSKLTPELQEKIVGYIKQSVPAETAARACGISESAYYKWMAKGRAALEAADGSQETFSGEDDSQPYVQFLQAVEKALAEAESRNVLIIQQKAAETWQAAAWMLERRYPERYGKREKIDMDAKVAVSLEDVLSQAWQQRGNEDGDDE